MYHQINQSKNYKSSQLNLTIYIGFFFLKSTKINFSKILNTSLHLVKMVK